MTGFYEEYFVKLKKLHGDGCMLILYDDAYEILFWIRNKKDMRESIEYGKKNLKGAIKYKVYKGKEAS